eukprot:gnl/MRDRNA2_/MRDRNA2_32236_c0_seq1.p1 gnl/MRDRNA2_/MRDRNA2_32236_c0~~gnl/MRDRNA2_/MRDRNA2_32236_c0_seq1.p1  ORF type:complete len:235 (+),score=19.64 gnl/MRDRNA2_/MRDRNA2_32236_c0_seq1:209-913(+)
MVHGPLMHSWSLLGSNEQARLVCNHWHYGCSVAERIDRQATNMRRPRLRYSAKTQDGHIKSSGSKSRAGRACRLLTFAGVGGLFVVIFFSGAILFTLGHIVLLICAIILMSSHCAAKLSQAGILRRLARRHWIFDGTAESVVMIAVLLLLLLGSSCMRNGGMAAVFPVTHVFPMFLFMLGCFLSDAITKRDFHQFIKAKTGTQKTVSEIRLQRQETPATCPVCDKNRTTPAHLT